MSSAPPDDEKDKGGTSITLPLKRRKPGAFTKEEKEVIMSAYNSAMDTNPNKMISAVVKKTSKTTGVCESSVYNVLREYKSSRALKSPKLLKTRRKIVDDIHNLDRNAIRKEVHQFYFRNDLPTLDKVLKVVNEDGTLPDFRRTTFYKLLKDLNFRCIKHAQDSALIDRDDIILCRRKYLSALKTVRSEGRQVYYLGETLLSTVHKKNKPRKNDSDCLLIVHIGNHKGFLDGGLWLYECKKNRDLQEDIVAQKYEKWFTDILPMLEEKAAIVVDNAAHQTRKVERAPNITWPKEEIKHWLASKDIHYDDKMLKAELMKIVKENKDRFNAYVVDELARSHGRTVLRLPPYHSELNPLERIWPQIRNTANKLSSETDDVQSACIQAINEVGPATWEKCVRFVENEVEKRMWELDDIMETAVEPLLTTTTYDSSDSLSDLSDDM